MRRRILMAAAILATAALVAWEARRAAIAWFLVHGEFAKLERWGGDAYFLTAVRRYPKRSRECWSFYQLVEWTDHRYHGRFPGERVQDMACLPTGELMVLLRSNDPDHDFECRLVVLDSPRAESIIASSERIDLNGWSMDVAYFPAWREPAILIHGGGSMDVADAFRREGRGFVPLGYRWGHDETPSFFSRGGSWLEDVDGDGIPEVLSLGERGTTCPACGRYSEYTVFAHKLFTGTYFSWTEWGQNCGPTCSVHATN